MDYPALKAAFSNTMAETFGERATVAAAVGFGFDAVSVGFVIFVATAATQLPSRGPCRLWGSGPGAVACFARWPVGL